MENYWLFLSASFFLWITPGQDTVYIIARSIAQGRFAGIVSALGIGTGAMVHAALATAGVSMIIVASPVLFLLIKITGGLYLIYLGVNALLSKSTGNSQGGIKYSKLLTIYYQGLVTNILNPKVALFLPLLPSHHMDSSEQKV